MTNAELTDFQRKTLQAIRRMFETGPGEIDEVQILKGVVPFYSSDPITCVKIVAGNLKIFLFEDEANYSSSVGGEALERPQFESEEELARNLMERLQEVRSQ